MILLLFFCSGVTALVYEVIWSKYLTLLFGSTVYAQTVVLAVFMGGLALGNRLFGSRADRSRQPLALYGYLEVAIGLYAFFFPTIYKAADGIFTGVGSKLLDNSIGLLALKGILSAALLLGPTILMGGTLPILAAWLQRRMSDAGRRSALFYSVNSLGAVCGSGLAGFFLVTWLGVPVTLQMTALTNVLIGFAAVGMARMLPAEQEVARTVEKAVPAQDPAVAGSSAFRWGCVLVTLTGAVSMGLEVLASRCLVLIFGGSLQAFAIVLMAFILGIGLGSAVIASLRRKEWPKEAVTVGLVLGAAVWIGLLVFNIESLMEVYRKVRSGVASTEVGYSFYLGMAALFSIVILGLPAAALGAVLPLWIRVISETSNLLGDRVGRLLTCNTLGAVGGVLATGFVLMPWIGLRGSFIALALVLSCAALLVAWMRQKRAAAALAFGVACMLVVIGATGSESWRLVLSSGAFRWRETNLNPLTVREIRKDEKLLFYEDAPDATVSVEDNNTPERILRVNGKPDASSLGDLSAQYMIAHLPLMVKPDSKDAFVFGMGSGISVGAALGYPLERLVVAENCGPVLRAAKYFDRWNGGALTDPRVRVCREDARTVLKLSPQQFDVIIAEPSNPWTVGIGSVFSRDFYQIAKQRLKPGGIMAQWFHIYEMNDGIVEMVVRTFGTVFPVMEIWEVNGGDIIMLGSDQPWPSGPDLFERALALERPRQQLSEIGLGTPDRILARQFASQRTGFAVSGPGPIQTDDFPVLEYQAPKAFFVGRRATRLFRFDERTWQSGVALPDKIARLAALDNASLQSAFGIYHSANRDVEAHLRLRYGQNDRQVETTGGGSSVPCVFSVTNLVIKAPPAGATNQTVQRLFEAELALRSDPAGHPQALEAIRSILDSTKSYDPAKAGWSAAYYSGVATRLSLRHNDPHQAKQFLLRGLQLDPESETLQYLARILIREGVIQFTDAETQFVGTGGALVVRARERPQ